MAYNPDDEEEEIFAKKDHDYKKEGKGIFTWANGDSYCGQWENDEYHGKGILKKDGIIKDGYWDKGEFMGN